MKTNLLYNLKSNVPAGEKCIDQKSELTMLLLLLVALAAAGCETLDSGSPGAVTPPSSSWSAAATGYPAHAAEPGFAANLGGRWYHDGNAASINVAPDGRNLTIINEQGRRSDGYATTAREIEIPSLGIRGHVSHSGRRISWTNGTEWTREARRGGSESGQAQELSGRWYHDGKPTSISVSFGGSVSVTNEHGQSSSGSMFGNEIVLSGGLRGHVGHGGQRISWSNGTEWTR
jgi:hypothetical protein